MSSQSSLYITAKNSVTDSVVAPKGGILCILYPYVEVEWDMPWRDQVRGAGPNTDESGNIWNVGHLYQPDGTMDIKPRLILLNYPNGGGNLPKALKWARSQGLENTWPQEAFAIGKQHPEFRENVKQGLAVNVVATTKCVFLEPKRTLVCCVWFGKKAGWRQAATHGPEQFCSLYTWFAFRR